MSASINGAAYERDTATGGEMRAELRTVTPPDMTSEAPPDAQLLPPHSIEAEQGVLGSLMLDNSALEIAAGIVQVEDFYTSDHRLIFRAISEVITAGDSADVVMVSERLKAAGKLAEVGGVAYLNEIVSNTPSAAHSKQYAEIVAERSRLRTLAAIGRDIQGRAYAPGADIDEVRDVARIQLEGIAVPGKSTFRAVSLREMIDRPPAQWTIKGLLPRHGIGTIYGEYGSGKSFVTLDTVMAPARELDEWRALRVKGGGVVYIYAEGAGGAPQRIKAYCQHHGVNPDSVRLEIIADRIDLRNPGAQLQELVRCIRDAAKRIGEVVIVVVDTLTRTMPGGSDNKPEDMSAYVENCVALGESAGAFVLIVHHTGKDLTKGSRGHSSLPAAVDVEIEVKRDDDGNGTITIKKSRDGQDGGEFGFRLEVVDLGTGPDGDPIGSCVVVPTEAQPIRRKARDLTAAGKIALQAIKEAVVDHGKTMAGSSTIPKGVRAVHIKDWRKQFDIRYGTDDGGGEREKEAIRKAFTRGKDELLKANAVAMSNPYIWVTG